MKFNMKCINSTHSKGFIRLASISISIRKIGRTLEVLLNDFSKFIQMSYFAPRFLYLDRFFYEVFLWKILGVVEVRIRLPCVFLLPKFFRFIIIRSALILF